MSDLFDAQTKDQIESRMVQNLHTLTDTDKTAIEGSFARDMIDTNAVEFENSYEGEGPFGAKSIGEVVINTPLPAISDAIRNAVGKRFYELPITPEKIAMAAMEQK